MQAYLQILFFLQVLFVIILYTILFHGSIKIAQARNIIIIRILHLRFKFFTVATEEEEEVAENIKITRIAAVVKKYGMDQIELLLV